MFWGRGLRISAVRVFGALSAILAAVLASGAVFGIINDRNVLTSAAFALVVALEAAPDLLLVGWFSFLILALSPRRLGRSAAYIVACAVACIVCIGGTWVLARLVRLEFSVWWQEGAPLIVPAIFLAVGAAIGIAYACFVVWAAARVERAAART